MNDDISERKFLIRLSIGIGIVSVLLLFFALAGPGKLVVELPSNATVRLNGHVIESSSTRKIRHGTYTLTVSSPTVVKEPQEIHIGMFKTTVVTESTLKKRDVNDILTSVVPSSGFYGVSNIGDTRWFENDTWLVGTVGPGSLDFIALHFTKDKGWSPDYYTAVGYSQDYSVLPADALAYLHALEKQYEQGN